jgi:hypothetical protein
MKPSAETPDGSVADNCVKKMPNTELARLELLAEVDSLVDRLHRWADGAPDWRPAEKCQALVRRLTERAAALRVRIEAPLVVATLGGTGTGKSALVNALVGEEVVQAGRARPTTMRPTIVCRPGLTPEMLGIDPTEVEIVQRDLPALRDLVLIDCPDPDTTEETETGEASTQPSPTLSAAHSNLSRLRAILPKCDVLLVTATQQKYRSARVIEELTAAAPGAHLVFVQTHADVDDDIREDWRTMLGEACRLHPIFRIDSLQALSDLRNGLQPRGDFAELLDLLTRQLAGAASNRIRRANFLDLTAETLDACRNRIEDSTTLLRDLQNAIDEQRNRLGRQIAVAMQSELSTSRRSWENRLLAQTASRWGFSPFALVLRAYQGIGGIASGALLYRARTPAQVALWGAMEGVRTWRKHQESHQADRSLDRGQTGGFQPAETRQAAMIVEGYALEAGLDRGVARWETVAAESDTAAGNFVGRVASELESLIVRLAERHTGWLTRCYYEILLLAMLGTLLYRLGKNFFYDSWLSGLGTPVFGLDFYVSAGFWLVLWCLVLLWMFSRRLRRGLQGEINCLASNWQDAAAGIFVKAESECRRVTDFRRELADIRQEVERLQRRVGAAQ